MSVVPVSTIAWNVPDPYEKPPILFTGLQASAFFTQSKYCWAADLRNEIHFPKLVRLNHTDVDETARIVIAVDAADQELTAHTRAGRSFF